MFTIGELLILNWFGQQAAKMFQDKEEEGKIKDKKGILPALGQIQPCSKQTSPQVLESSSFSKFFIYHPPPHPPNDQFHRHMRSTLCVQRCLPLTCLPAHSTPPFTCTWQFDYGQ